MNRLIVAVLLSLALLRIGCTPLSGRARSYTGEIVITYRELRAGDADVGSYDSKCIVYVDGTIAAESEVGDRYDTKTVTLNLHPGEHVIVVEGSALKNRRWEKITTENGYPLTHRLEKTLSLKAGESRSLNFIAPDRADNIKISF